MARDEAPPFDRGASWYNGETIDSNDLGGPNLEGKEYTFEPTFVTSSAAPADGSGRPVRVKIVRNTSGVPIKPGRVCVFQAADPYEGKVDGYAYAIGDRVAGVSDEYLPAAGVPNNDLFYLVIDGPTKVTQPASGQATLAIGDRLVPVAGGAASKTDNLGGRVAKQDLTGATATLGNNLQNFIGYAGEANNTANAMVKAVVHRAYR